MTVIAPGFLEDGSIRQWDRKKRISPLRLRMIKDMELAGLCAGTQEAYIGAVVAVQNHYGIRPDRLAEKQVYDYVLWMRDEKKVAKGTFQAHFYGLKFFYYRCLGYDWALFTIKKVRQPNQKRLPVALSRDDCRELIAAIRKPAYRLCCSTMYAFGLRLNEALSFPISAIDSSRMEVRIIGKRNKERILPLPESLLLEFRRFWSIHRNEVWLFPNMSGSNHLCRKSVYRAFTDAKERVGLGSKVTTHCLRHSFATNLLEDGVDTRKVQMLLGHASIRSTEIYTHFNEGLRKDLQKHIDHIVSDLLSGGSRHE